MRRYLSYSEADFEVFRPAGATRCTDGVKFGSEEGPSVPSSVANFTPIGTTGAATVHRATINRATVNRRQFTGRYLTGVTINRSDN